MSTIPVRVTVLDTWDEYGFDLPPDTLIADLKRQALVAARVTRAPGGYLVKYRGAELPEDGVTLADAGLVPNGALIVMPRRREPTR